MAKKVVATLGVKTKVNLNKVVIPQKNDKKPIAKEIESLSDAVNVLNALVDVLQIEDEHEATETVNLSINVSTKQLAQIIEKLKH